MKPFTAEAKQPQSARDRHRTSKTDNSNGLLGELGSPPYSGSALLLLHTRRLFSGLCFTTGGFRLG